MDASKVGGEGEMTEASGMNSPEASPPHRNAPLAPATAASVDPLACLPGARALVVAVIARDRHCAWPGCQRPPTWCEAHHLTHWADGGATALDNLALLCGEHHGELHATGWELRLRDGRPVPVPPHGYTPPANSRHPHAA